MVKFYYQALDADRRPVSGELESDDLQQAIAALTARGLTVQSIEQVAPDSWSRPVQRSSRDAKRAGIDVEREVLRGHLARVRSDGAAIAPALRAYAQQMPRGRQRRELLTLIRVLERGHLDEAERAFRKLPEYWIPLLSAAASSRDPGRVLLGFLEESQQADELRRQWWLTWAYPLVVACLAAAVVVSICVLIVPGFGEIFQEFGLQLPGLTRLILRLSEWINSAWTAVVVGILIVVGALAAYAAHWLPWSMLGWLPDRLRMPFGRTTAIARFTQFLSDLLEAGLAVPDALRIAAVSSRRWRFRRAAGRLADQIESDADVPFEDYEHVLTATALYALQSEMPAGSRIRLLKEISQSYTERAHARLSWTRGVLEPIAILAIGLAVGLIVLALFLPLVKLVEGLD